MSIQDSGKKKLLHIGCGPQHILGKHGFDLEEWEEIRLDVEASVQPDIIGTMTDMKDVATGSVNAIFSSHNLEHLVPHELPVAMGEFLRVLKDDGYLVVTLPDLQQVARLVAQDKLDEPAYHTGAGLPICPMDILYGWRLAMANGQPYMAHRMGFTARTLQKALMQAGFGSVAIKRGNGDFALYAVASKPKLTSEALLELFNRHWSGGGGTNTLAGRKEEPAVNIAEPSECSPKRSLEKLYLYTLKKSLLGDFYPENDVRLLYLAKQTILKRPVDWSVIVDPEAKVPDLFSHVRDKKAAGEVWYYIPVKNAAGRMTVLNLRNMTDFAYTMIGQRRMDNIEDCLDIIRSENIPGDLMETGVCRGGAVVFMAGYLKTYNMEDRKIWAADSFEGLPRPSAKEDSGYDFSKAKYPVLAISLEKVMEAFARYGLLFENLIFLRGWFRNTLPKAPVEKLALLRLDGDLYESTKDALENMYDKVVPGGFIIIDDYNVFEPCKRAVNEFREKRGIRDVLVTIDPSSVYWRKGI